MPVYRDDKANLNFYYYGDVDAPAGAGRGKQVFPDLLDEARASGQRFVDPNFPADESSLGKDLNLTYSNTGGSIDIEWKRPTEIAEAMFSSKPLFHDNYTQFNVKQGLVGDCWFLCVVADAATKPAVINNLVPEDNVTVGFDSGVFHFRLWCRGKWVDVAVDDQLPCQMVDGKIVNTIMSRPTKEGGFWAPLLEKAYAKVFGKYGDIAGGIPGEAMEDFTGGFLETYTQAEASVGDTLKNALQKAVKGDCLIGLGTAEIPLEMRERHPDGSPGNEHVSFEGIVGLHAYSVLDIQEVTNVLDPSVKHTLVSIRNPWGTDTEWTGDFSDKDPNKTWALVKPDLRTGTPDDGQFWIPIHDFLKYTSSVYICQWGAGYRGDETIEPKPGAVFYIDNDRFTQENTGQIKYESDYEGKSGYLVNLKALPETEGLGEVKDGDRYNCGLSVNMIYKNYKKSSPDPAVPSFGFRLVWSDKDDVTNLLYFKAKKVLSDYVRPPRTADAEGGFFREASYHGNLPSGSVFVIPWLTNWDGQESEFLIRIIAEGKVTKINAGWKRQELNSKNMASVLGNLGLDLGGFDLASMGF